MTKHKTINGWTKELMKAQLRLNMTAKSESTDEQCLYRAVVDGNPTACAVGCFIPDNVYSEELEGNLIYFRVFEKQTKDVAFPLKPSGLNAMQRIHDDSNLANPLEEVCAWIDENVEDA